MRILISLLLAVSCFAGDAARIRIGSPVTPWVAGGAFAFTTHVLDAANDAIDWHYPAAEDATVTHLCVHHASSTGSARQYLLQLTALDGSSVPSTVLATAKIDPVTSSFGANTLQCAAITHDGAGGTQSSYATSQGTNYGVKVNACPNTTAPCTDSTAPDGSNNSTFNVGGSATILARGGFPHLGTTNAGSRTKQNYWPIFGLRSASKSYGNIVSTMNVGTQISSGSSVSMLFNIPTQLGSTYKVAGVEFTGRAAATKTVRIALYSGTTEISNCFHNFDTDYLQTVGSDNRAITVFFPSACGALNTATDYRVDFSPQDASSAFAVASFTFAAAGDRTAFPGSTWFHQSTRSSCTGVCDSESFTDDTTTRPLVNLILSEITAPSSGSIGGGFAIAQ